MGAIDRGLRNDLRGSFGRVLAQIRKPIFCQRARRPRLSCLPWVVSLHRVDPDFFLEILRSVPAVQVFDVLRGDGKSVQGGDGQRDSADGAYFFYPRIFVFKNIPFDGGDFPGRRCFVLAIYSGALRHADRSSARGFQKYFNSRRR